MERGSIGDRWARCQSAHNRVKSVRFRRRFAKLGLGGGAIATTMSRCKCSGPV